uniref:Phospholipase A2 group IVC n=1 Tax=Seriola dumerili TaxID=41447 RepID=A0A3B4VPK9_SERDU
MYHFFHSFPKKKSLNLKSKIKAHHVHFLFSLNQLISSPQKPIRQSHALCAGEQEYVDRRKRVVLESINSLEINCTADSVPHIALLASGGGQRAAVGLVGSLYQMEKDGLLDTLLYLGGVSGSTWSMSSLYSDPQWCTNMDTAVSKLSGPGVGLEQALAWLDERAKEELFSLTDIWGVLTSAGIMKQMDLRRLSDEASRNATNPYPIYSAIEKQCFSNGPIEGKWFEVSPHEAGFTEIGLFVKTSLLGSKFQRGELLEEKPEMDMVKLQGWFSLLTKHIIPLIMKWEWGTTRNFLYQYQDFPIPPCLRCQERFHLVDAGMLINVAYPPFLGDKRDIDLIIAPEYSAGNMFEALDYAAEVNKPFPEIDDKILEERDWPKDCYVFEGNEKAPTIIYMPLFNRQNCKGLLHTLRQNCSEFSTFQRPFSQEKIMFVLETVKANMKNNKETLLRAINNAVVRRQNKR